VRTSAHASHARIRTRTPTHMRRHSLTRVGYPPAYMRAVRKKRARTGASTGNTRSHAPACARVRECSHELCRHDRTAARAQRTTYNSDDLRQAHAFASYIIRKKRPAHRRAAQSFEYYVLRHIASVLGRIAYGFSRRCLRRQTLLSALSQGRRAAGPQGAHAQVHAALRCGGESAVGDGAPTDRPCGPIGCHSVRL
jgi:hypothetical protein